ncbi:MULTISPECIES: heme-binding protein [unclassified Arthrobacter]|uniref:heme-degrading domain-containing protein n=1 Tax=unclassified Arthrobacter TaxID=235627 RepID=UPI002882E2B6|nr:MULTISPECIES: heme-binding protein [unclassified Arthrobacter]
MRTSFDSFTLRDAWRIGVTLVQRCIDEKLPVTIGIWLGEQRIFHCANEGTSADNDAWIERKANSVRRFECSSIEAHKKFGDLGLDFYTWFGVSPADYALAGGAVPIFVRGSLVGVIAVSGLESSEDHELACWALAQ